MIRSLLRPAALVLSGMLALSVTLVLAGGCRGEEEACRAEPLPPLQVVLERGGLEFGTPLEGTITAAERMTDPAGLHLTLRDAGQENWPLRIEAIDDSLPADSLVGAAIRVEITPGWPTVSGFTITDERGLLLAGASDQSAGGHVLKDGVPGFTLALEDGGCEARPGPSCTRSVRNLQLAVGHDDARVALPHGHSARLGEWTVRCLVAWKVEYDPKCADAGLFALSWLIVRR